MSEHTTIDYSFSVPYRLRVFFAEKVFNEENSLFRDLLCSQESCSRKKVLFYVDQAAFDENPSLESEIRAYFESHSNDLRFMGLFALHGGESLKNDDSVLDRIYSDIERLKICRHSYLVGIGGGAFLDVVGFAAATAHRGIRHIRFPTTTLGQADAGVGVKNGVNFNGKKNFVGAFAPPFAVVNDSSFLDSLSATHKRNGYVEAVKVSLIRDVPFFQWIEENVESLNRFESTVMNELIQRCAQHHVEHISSSGDPFEMGSVRPLDFGHWAAHKLEQMSDFSISHGEAVAIGIAIDTLYSEQKEFIVSEDRERIISVLKNLGFDLYSDVLETRSSAGSLAILDGLEEFREHLGGILTITLLKKIGKRFEVHEMDTDVVVDSIKRLKEV